MVSKVKFSHIPLPSILAQWSTQPIAEVDQTQNSLYGIHLSINNIFIHLLYSDAWSLFKLNTRAVINKVKICVIVCVLLIGMWSRSPYTIHGLLGSIHR